MYNSKPFISGRLISVKCTKKFSYCEKGSNGISCFSIYIYINIRTDSMLRLLYHIEADLTMTDVAKKVKNASQDFEAKIKTEKDYLEDKPSSETLNKAKIN
jgi:hypothetical protein